MDKESQTCGHCSQAYNTTDRIPRILNCAHTLCSLCLTKILNNTPGLRKCPFDSLAFSEAQESLENFPLNVALLTLIEREKRSLCQVHGEELTDICLRDRVEVCHFCTLFGDHKGHSVKKLKELKAKGIQAKEDLKEKLNKLGSDSFEKNKEVESMKKKFISKMETRFGEINKFLKTRQHEWKIQVESLFERHNSQFKEEISKAIEEIDQILQNEEYLTLLDRDFSSVISRLQPQVSTGEMSRLAKETSRMMSSLNSFLANQEKLMKDFDFSHEETMIEEIPEEPQQLSLENSTEPKHELRLEKSILKFGIAVSSGTLKIWINNRIPMDTTVDLNLLNKMKRVNVVFEQYDSLFQDSNDLDSLPQILDQLSYYTSLFINFAPSGLTDHDAISLLDLLFPKVQHLTEISMSFAGCEIGNETIASFCAEILPKATCLKSFILNLGSTILIDDLSLFELTKSLFPFRENLEILNFELSGTKITDEGIEKIFNVVHEVKKFSLKLKKTWVTDQSLKVLGENVMPFMKNLKKFSLDVSETKITMEGVNAIFTGIPLDMEYLELNFKHVDLSEGVISLFEEKVCPKLELVEDVHLWLEGKDLREKVAKILENVRNEAKNKRKYIESNNVAGKNHCDK